jgi:hypothetical protein
MTMDNADHPEETVEAFNERQRDYCKRHGLLVYATVSAEGGGTVHIPGHQPQVVGDLQRAM